jgi:hypothetical protein
MRRTSAARRRQRSVRVAFAAAVLLVSTAGATTGLLLDDPVALAVALVVSVVCGWAALRIMVVELRQQRREHARERAAMARSFHQEYAAQASGRRSAQRTAGELEATLRLSDARARHAEQQARREGARADTAERRVTDLEVTLAIRSAEEADELASWDAQGGSRESWDVDTVVDLLSWTGAPERSAPQRQAL